MKCACVFISTMALNSKDLVITTQIPQNCLHINFPFTSTALASYGAGTGIIWIDNVLCRGNEEGLSQCLHSGWGVHNCGHSEDASVICDGKFLHIDSMCLRWVSNSMD